MKIEFTCPECGDFQLVEVLTEATIQTEVVSAAIEDGWVDLGYADAEDILEGRVQHYMCGNCGWVIAEDNAELMQKLEENNWLKPDPLEELAVRVERKWKEEAGEEICFDVRPALKQYFSREDLDELAGMSAEELDDAIEQGYLDRSSCLTPRSFAGFPHIPGAGAAAGVRHADAEKVKQALEELQNTEKETEHE